MIYTGQTKDGIFAREALGMFVNPQETEWSTEPYTKDQQKIKYEYDKETKKIKQLIELGIDCKERVIEEIEKIDNGTSILPHHLRKFLLKI